MLAQNVLSEPSNKSTTISEIQNIVELVRRFCRDIFCTVIRNKETILVEWGSKENRLYGE